MSSDRSLYPRLKQLFSTGVVVRRSGGKALKVSDFDALQSFGTLQGNSMADRYTRLHTNSAFTQAGNNYGTQISRSQIYVDYEAMDTDALCSKALDILSEEATQKSEIGEVLSVRSSNENIQDELYNLFYRVLNIEFNLPMWIRTMCKYGDAFLNLKVEEGMGIYNVEPKTVYSMIREEGQDANNGTYIRFVEDPGAVSGGANASISSKGKNTYENFQMAHFRLLTDPNYMPYGRSWFEPARKLFKSYVLLEDAAILHRVMRAPEKRVFYYNVGNIPANEIDAFMQKQLNNSKKTPLIDPQTGQYNLKYNMMNMLEDFHIPVRNNDNTTRIDTTKGLEYAGMDDIYYFQNKILAALAVPKAYLNYSDELNGKSTLAGLSMNFSKSIEKLQRRVIKELEKIAQVHLFILGYDESDLSNFKLSLTTPSTLAEQEKIALLKEKVALIGDIMDKKILSSDWCLDYVMQMSEDQINQQRELVTEDIKRAFRWSQIENEGNDPAISGVSYGTPHDLASIYKNNAGKGGDQNLPDGYDELKKIDPVGRPRTHASIYGTDASSQGRDPLGKVDNNKSDKTGTIKPVYRGGPMAMEGIDKSKLEKFRKPNKVMVFEQQEPEMTLLDERNILDIE